MQRRTFALVAVAALVVVAAGIFMLRSPEAPNRGAPVSRSRGADMKPAATGAEMKVEEAPRPNSEALIPPASDATGSDAPPVEPKQ